MNLLQRRDATQATLDWFAARPFDWGRSATCVHMVRRHLRAMGHKVPPMPRFRSALGARKALEAKGWDSLTAMMDSVLPGIAPAEALVGDVVEMPGESEAFSALCVVVGNGRVMGYFEGEAGLAVLQPVASPVRAWRA